MQALSWDGKALRLVPSLPTPKADDRTAVVRVSLAGICSTDLQILKGYMNFRGVPGHEFVGEVREGPGELVGKRVVGEINFACGKCEFCVSGLGRHCPGRRVMGILGADGSFSLPGNLDADAGTVSLIAITSSFPPRGSWEFSSRIENPTTGALLSEDLNAFTVQ